MAIRTLPEMQNVDFANNITRSITPENIRNFADSVMAVGGTMYANNVTLDATTTWAAIKEFTNSVDTKGVTEDLVNGVYTIDSGADGTYLVHCMLCIDAPATGDFDIMVYKNGAATPYQVTYTATANVKQPFPVGGTGNLVAGDTIGIAIKAAGNVTIDLIHASLRLTRI